LPLTHHPPATLDLDFVRQQFPSLAGDWVFFDNAGGSQILKPVVDRITAFLYESNVQLGASYAVSQLATERVAAGAKAMATLINAADPAEVVLGSSTSALLRMLAQCFRPTLAPGDEIIVTNADHEANISPWVELEREGIVIKIWRVNPTTFELDLADLEALLTPQTRLVRSHPYVECVGQHSAGAGDRRSRPRPRGAALRRWGRLCPPPSH
jgi:selenocysteine lyase/cysteine desulfurase